MFSKAPSPLHWTVQASWLQGPRPGSAAGLSLVLDAATHGLFLFACHGALPCSSSIICCDSKSYRAKGWLSQALGHPTFNLMRCFLSAWNSLAVGSVPVSWVDCHLQGCLGLDTGFPTSQCRKTQPLTCLHPTPHPPSSTVRLPWFSPSK